MQPDRKKCRAKSRIDNFTNRDTITEKSGGLAGNIEPSQLRSFVDIREYLFHRLIPRLVLRRSANAEFFHFIDTGFGNASTFQ